MVDPCWSPTKDSGTNAVMLEPGDTAVGDTLSGNSAQRHSAAGHSGLWLQFLILFKKCWLKMALKLLAQKMIKIYKDNGCLRSQTHRTRTGGGCQLACTKEELLSRSFGAVLQPQQRGRCAMLAHSMPHSMPSPRSFYKPIAAGIFGVKTQQPGSLLRHALHSSSDLIFFEADELPQL